MMEGRMDDGIIGPLRREVNPIGGRRCGGRFVRPHSKSSGGR